MRLLNNSFVKMFKVVVIVLFFSANVCVEGAGMYEGDSCIKDGAAGTCTLLSKCQSAIADLHNRIRPQKCSFSPREPIVCCLGATKPVLTTERPTTTTEYIPKLPDYVEVSGVRGGCAPLSAALTAQRTGKKAWDKCLEYQEKFVYPCGRSASLAESTTRLNQCRHKTDGLIVGGIDAERWEFPHMALLGFGPDPANWVCAGTIISERFIVTAGHCTYSRDFSSNVTFVRIGMLRKSETLDLARVYRVSRILKHPEYNPPKKYNDLALLETEKPMALDQYTVPACLDVAGAGVVLERALASGWGLTEHNGAESDLLQKVILTKFTDEECERFYRPGPNTDRHFKLGYQPATQLCYGDKETAKDTCQGDSGGPLQVKNRRINCMYTLVGVTSFGKGCGVIGAPAIYTRISHYVDWIERIVWP
ncbi:serine protease snake [Plutella xylostella]|uniref:serine protease snake n=1 Tax=Plutella xylostella TaxID=51655 RepID=UPI00203246D5|nr:serine protease snake [Plutella xylostella]